MNTEEKLKRDQEEARRAALAAAEMQTYNDARMAAGPLSRLPAARQALILAEIFGVVGPDVLREALRLQSEAKAQEKEKRKRAEQFHELEMKRNALIEVWFPKLFKYYGIREFRVEVDANLQKETLKNIIEQRDRILEANAEDLGFTPEVKSQALTHLNSLIEMRRGQGEDEADSLSLLRKVSNVFRGR